MPHPTLNSEEPIKTILCTEDDDPWALKLALSSAGLSEDAVKITSFNGLNNAFTAEAFREMAELMHSAPRVIVHRDRDFLTDSELSKWSETFTTRDIRTFCPRRSDTEAYHASAEHIAEVTGMPISEATDLRNDVLSEVCSALRKKHREKRRDANRKYLDGGAPRTEDLWPEGEAPTEAVIYGKLLLAQVTLKLRQLGKLAKGDALTNYPSDELREELLEALSADDGPVEFHSGLTSGGKK